LISSEWKRIAGVHLKEEGDIAAIWLAHDKDADVIHVYDACTFRLEVLPVIAEGLNARGRWIPVAWDSESKAMSDKLLDRGCNMLRDPNENSPAVAEVISREIWERMRTGRFKVDKRLKNWTDEFSAFQRENSKVPTRTFPLMAATRHAMSQLTYARRLQSTKSKPAQAARIAIV
jgi:hypothetical protein